jgi:hypothetical protein
LCVRVLCNALLFSAVLCASLRCAELSCHLQCVAFSCLCLVHFPHSFCASCCFVLWRIARRVISFGKFECIASRAPLPRCAQPAC